MNHVTVVPAPNLEPADERGWRFPVATESDIVTLATICHMKQQQREPLGPTAGACKNDWCDDEELDDNDDRFSTCLVTLTTDGTRAVKMIFLDRLAEVLCCQKLASYVTCTSMIELEDTITVIAARNAKWRKEDVQFMNEIATIMEQIASKGVTDIPWCISKN
jgi:hypothetical protein